MTYWTLSATQLASCFVRKMIDCKLPTCSEGEKLLFQDHKRDFKPVHKMQVPRVWRHFVVRQRPEMYIQELQLYHKPATRKRL